MAIRSGKILHDAGKYVIDRIQSAGPTLNIPQEKIYELGNYKSITTIAAVPEIKFDLWDVRMPSNYRVVAINREVTPL